MVAETRILASKIRKALIVSASKLVVERPREALDIEQVPTEERDL